MYDHWEKVMGLLVDFVFIVAFAIRMVLPPEWYVILFALEFSGLLLKFNFYIHVK